MKKTVQNTIYNIKYCCLLLSVVTHLCLERTPKMDKDTSICKKYICIFTVLLCLLMISMSSCLWAETPYKQSDEVIDKTHYTLQRFLHHESYSEFRKMLKDAKAILVVPDLFKAGFLASIESGDGVLLVRRPTEKTQKGWSYPVFYEMTSGSLGLQLGVQSMEVVFLIMSDHGLKSVLNDTMKVGADASLAIGLLGGGLEASSDTNGSADIFAFAMAKGVYGGVGLKGSWVNIDHEKNHRFYGPEATAQAIIYQGLFQNSKADRLLDVLQDY